MHYVYDSQNNTFQVYCDFDSEVNFVWTLVESFSLGNVNQLDTKRFGVDFPVNEDDGAINWEIYRLSLSRMQSIAGVSTHLRATCNFPGDGLVYTDNARAHLEGHDLFGAWVGECCMYEFVNIRGIECRDCTAGALENLKSHFTKSGFTLEDKVYYLRYKLSIIFRIVTTLHAAFIWLPFLIGQVRFQVWCRPYLAAYFGFFELRKFPWSPSKAQSNSAQ
ncbi:hypothetical protein ACROYT_G044032 [Oculina patagonica]